MFMMIIATEAPQVIEVKKIRSSPGILLIKLDIVRIIDRTHIFLLEVDLTNIEYNIKKPQKNLRKC